MPFSHTKFTTLFRLSTGIEMLIMSLILILLPIVSSAQSLSKSDAEISIKTVTNQIKKVTDNLNANKKLFKSERDKLAVLEQEIKSLRQQELLSEAALNQQQTKIRSIEQRIEQINQSQRDNQAALDALVLNRYKAGSPNYLKLILNQDNPYAVGRLNHYFTYFTDAQQAKLADLRAEFSEIKQLQRAALAHQTELKKVQSEINSRTEKLRGLRADRQQSLSRLDKKISSSEDQLKQLQADRARLDKLLAEIAKQAERLRQIEKRKKEAEEEAQQAAGKPIAKPRAPVKGGFKKQRGRLSAPVTAPLKTRFGSRLKASGLPAQGHFYDTKKEQDVSAVFRGNVLFADYLKGYGLLLIIDHGDNHISLYGHNEVLYKRVGDSVSTGEIVAKSGTSGGLKQPGLYFEIRRNATPVDPQKWLNK